MAIASEDQREAINLDAQLPFGAWRDGKGLDQRTLARLLKPYGIRPRTVRLGERTPKGYRAKDFHDAWTRYAADPVSGSEAQHDHDPQHEIAHKHRDVADVALLADTHAEVS